MKCWAELVTRGIRWQLTNSLFVHRWLERIWEIVLVEFGVKVLEISRRTHNKHVRAGHYQKDEINDSILQLKMDHIQPLPIIH